MSATFYHNDTISTPISMGNIPELDFAHDYGLTETGAGSAVYAYTQGPVDLPESIRFATQDVSNVYNVRKDISPTTQSLTKRGKKLLVKNWMTARQVNSDGTNIDYPVNVGITLEWPISANLSEDVVYDAVKRTVSTLMGHADSSAELRRLMSGIVFKDR